MSVAVPVIASVDLSNPLAKRIHLLAGVTTYHPVDDIAMEILKRRADEVGGIRKVRLPVESFGNAPKDSAGSKRTSKFARFYDTKIIPFGDADIKVTGEQTYVQNGAIIGSEELVMDLSTVSINMSYAAPNTEVVVVNTGGSALTAQESAQLARVHSLLDVVENGLSHAEIMRILLSALAGKVSGAETGNINFRDNVDSKNRITAVTDGNGNRTSVTLDVS